MREFIRGSIAEKTYRKMRKLASLIVKYYKDDYLKHDKNMMQKEYNGGEEKEYDGKGLIYALREAGTNLCLRQSFDNKTLEEREKLFQWKNDFLFSYNDFFYQVKEGETDFIPIRKKDAIKLLETWRDNPIEKKRNEYFSNIKLIKNTMNSMDISFEMIGQIFNPLLITGKIRIGKQMSKFFNNKELYEINKERK